MKPEIFNYFEEAIRIGASDLILKPGSPPTYRVNKHLIISEDEALASQQMYNLFLPVIDAKQQENLQKNLNSTSIFTLSSTMTRIRYYIYKQRGGVAGSFRFIPNDVPSIKSLNLPDSLGKIVTNRKGLFLVTGPVCSGKTLSIAALVQSANEQFARHIITIEDSLEIIYKPKQSVFTQIEVGKVIQNYFEAVSNALREDADIIVIGQLNNQNIVEQALRAAETGHLVISSLPTFGPAQTIEQIVSMFSTEKQDEIRNQLASNLIGIFSQKLVPNNDYKQKASIAYELLLVNSNMRNLIKEQNYSLLASSMLTARKDGCIPFKDSLEKLKQNESVNRDYLNELLQEVE